MSALDDIPAIGIEARARLVREELGPETAALFAEFLLVSRGCVEDCPWCGGKQIAYQSSPSEVREVCTDRDECGRDITTEVH